MPVRLFIRVFVISMILAVSPTAEAASDRDRPVFGLGTMITIGGMFGSIDAKGLIDQDLFFRYVELDDDSAALARQIILQVRAATDEAMAEYQRRMPGMDGESAMLQASIPIAEKQGEAITNAVRELELLVPEDQQRAWDAFLSHQFRRGFFGFMMRGRSSSAGVIDLQDLTYDLGLWAPKAATTGDAESVSLILDGWSRSVDGLARSIDADFMALMDHLEEIREIEESDEGINEQTMPRQLMKIAQNLVESTEKTYRVTTENRDKLARTLSKEDGDRLLGEYRLRAYPAVYRARRIEIWLEDTLASGELTDEEQKALQGVHDGAQKRLKEVREAYLEAIDGVMEASWDSPFGGGADSQQAWARNMQASDDYDRAIMAVDTAVRAALTEERTIELRLGPANDNILWETPPGEDPDPS